MTWNRVPINRLDHSNVEDFESTRAAKNSATLTNDSKKIAGTESA
jgi:hypothetical protein